MRLRLAVLPVVMALAAIGTPTYAGGLMNTPSLVILGGGTFGNSVAVADINGDGFGDIIVGAPSDSGAIPYSHNGSVSIYLGSAAGPSDIPSRVLISPERNGTGSFGYSVARLGDWNGDGIDDFAVGEPGYQSKGAAHVYLGSATGPRTSPDWTAVGDRMSCCGYGQRVAGAGDVNGDGFSDLLVSNSYFQNLTGKAQLYHGAQRRASTKPAWTAVGVSENSLFGDELAGAGDVNNDGFDDVLVSDKGFQWPGGELGRVLLYEGRSQGLQTTASWVAVGQTSGVFGWSVASVGDLNADGFSDFAIGNNQFEGRGQAFVYLGSAAGPVTPPALTLTGDVLDASLGYAIASAGDVNNDGFDDFLISAARRQQTFPREGRVYLHLGSASGPSGTPAWFVDGGQPDANLAWWLAGGDVNGDGYSDAVLGNPNNNGDRVLLYLGIP